MHMCLSVTIFVTCLARSW